MPQSVFHQYESKMYPYRFRGEIHVNCLAGGTPSNPKVAEGWIRTKLAAKDDLLRQMVAETMVERGVDAEEATEIVVATQNVNGFKRVPTAAMNGRADPDYPEHKGELFLEGRVLKACLKEGASVAANAGAIPGKQVWGSPDNMSLRKMLKAWFPEHVFVVENRLFLGVTEPDDINQRFAHMQGRSAIVNEEILNDATFSFTVETDHNFTEEAWAAIWLHAERQGIGASRSQGFGRFTVTKWEPISDGSKSRRKRSS